MKTKRREKILELIRENEIETQEEMLDYLIKSGYQVTQATVSRDIRGLNLTKVSTGNGRQRYVSLSDTQEVLTEKYKRIFREGFLSMDMAQNILVIRTVSGMAMAVAAALDSLHFPEVVGTIAGDDTIMCAIRTVGDTTRLMERLRRMIEE